MTSTVMGECLIKSVNEIGYKLQLKMSTREIVLARKGASMFRLHLLTGEAEQVVKIECLGEEQYHIRIDETSGNLSITNDSSLASKFKICKGKFFTGAISLEVVGSSSPRFLRHHNWKIRADFEKSGASFNMDAAFFFEDPSSLKFKTSPKHSKQMERNKTNENSPPPKKKKLAPPPPSDWKSPRRLALPPKSPHVASIDETPAKSPRRPPPPSPGRKDATADRARIESLENEKESCLNEMTAMKKQHDAMRVRYNEIKIKIQNLREGGTSK